MDNAAIIRLRRAGFSEEQGDALAGLMDEQLVTKADLQLVRSELRNDIAGIRADMEILERDLTIRLGGMMVVGFGAMAGLITFLSHLPTHL